MDEQENRGSAARAAAHILAARATTGAKGAALATAQEAAPFLIKAAAGLLILQFSKEGGFENAASF